MNTYKKYCNRRGAQKGPETEESHCCPARMPIIGPILFSLFIFSPYFLPNGESDQSQHPESDELERKVLAPSTASTPGNQW